MITDDILVDVFRMADLESCVALSHVTRSSRAVWAALDTSVVRAKVLERVPWFGLGGGDFSSWTTCALVVVSRTKRALADTHGLGDRPVLLKSMAVPLSLSCNKVEEVTSVDISRDAQRRFSMNPLFPEERIETTVGKYAVLEGVQLLSSKTALDLSSMEISKSDYDKWSPPKTSTALTNKAVSSSSGIEVQLTTEEDGGTIEVIDENETFVLVRFSTSNHGPAEELLLKTPTTTRLEVDPEMSNGTRRLYKSDHNETGMINLLPERGALMYRLVGDGTENSQLFHIDDNMNPLVICQLTRFQQLPLFYNIHQRFFVCYEGYLFLFYEGRFHRLWVDLGIRTPGNEVLCAWNQAFPAIGSLLDSRQAVMEEGVEFRIMQGPGDLSRYVGIRGTGRVVGDLKTGTTYFAKDAAVADQFGIPFVENGALGFYTCEKRVMDVVETKFSEIIDGKSKDSNLAGFFDDLCEKDTRGELKKARKLKKMKRRKTKQDQGKDELHLNNQWQVDDYYRDFDWPLELSSSVFDSGELEPVF